MVTHLKHSEINKLKWDGCISASICPLPYALSWYLDVVSPGWEALVLNDYEAAMPLPCRVKLGINYVFTPLFVQQLGIFGKQGVDEKQFVDAIPAKFKYVDVNLNEANSFNGIANTNTLLNLDKTYQELYAAFSDNTKRNIKKAEKAGLFCKELQSADRVVELFKTNKGKDIAFSNADYETLNALITVAKSNNACTVWGVVNSKDEVCAGAVFISFKGRHIFLFSGNNEDARNFGAMPYLIAEFIKKHAATHTVLDFEGSNNTNLARFYLSFGSYGIAYNKLKINRLPFPLNKFKA